MYLNGDLLWAIRFSYILTKIGTGDYHSIDDMIVIPDKLYTLVTTVQQLIDHIYPEIKIQNKPIE